MPPPLRTLKLRAHEHHARIVPTHDERGRPFDEPGVDVRGERARALLAKSGPLVDWLLAREPGVRVRAIVLDFERRRAVVTLEGAPRPRVVTLTAASFEDFVARASGLIAEAGEEAHRVLRRRRG